MATSFCAFLLLVVLWDVAKCHPSAASKLNNKLRARGLQQEAKLPKKIDVRPLSSCPSNYRDGVNMKCDARVRNCNYGKQLCCGDESYSAKCGCSQSGIFRCKLYRPRQCKRSCRNKNRSRSSSSSAAALAATKAAVNKKKPVLRRQNFGWLATCPIKYSLGLGKRCTKVLRCKFGKTKCCGKTKYAATCVCSKHGIFRCKVKKPSCDCKNTEEPKKQKKRTPTKRPTKPLTKRSSSDLRGKNRVVKNGENTFATSRIFECPSTLRKARSKRCEKKLICNYGRNDCCGNPRYSEQCKCYKGGLLRCRKMKAEPCPSQCPDVSEATEEPKSESTESPSPKPTRWTAAPTKRYVRPPTVKRSGGWVSSCPTSNFSQGLGKRCTKPLLCRFGKSACCGKVQYSSVCMCAKNKVYRCKARKKTSCSCADNEENSKILRAQKLQTKRPTRHPTKRPTFSVRESKKRLNKLPKSVSSRVSKCPSNYRAARSKRCSRALVCGYDEFDTCCGAVRFKKQCKCFKGDVLRCKSVILRKCPEKCPESTAKSPFDRPTRAPTSTKRLGFVYKLKIPKKTAHAHGWLSKCPTTYEGGVGKRCTRRMTCKVRYEGCCGQPKYAKKCMCSRRGLLRCPSPKKCACDEEESQITMLRIELTSAPSQTLVTPIASPTAEPSKNQSQASALASTLVETSSTITLENSTTRMAAPQLLQAENASTTPAPTFPGTTAAPTVSNSSMLTGAVTTAESVSPVSELPESTTNPVTVVPSVPVSSLPSHTSTPTTAAPSLLLSTPPLNTSAPTTAAPSTSQSNTTASTTVLPTLSPSGAVLNTSTPSTLTPTIPASASNTTAGIPTTEPAELSPVEYSPFLPSEFIEASEEEREEGMTDAD